jgi:hypothetical protein
MYTTSGAEAAARPAQATRASGTSRTTRQRLVTLVRTIEAYVAGRDSIPEPPAPFPTPAPVLPPATTPLTGGAGSAVVPLGPDRVPSPQRPRPLDKPLAVAHYEMLARQVAYERQVYDLAHGPRSAVPAGAARGVLRGG